MQLNIISPLKKEILNIRNKSNALIFRWAKIMFYYDSNSVTYESTHGYQIVKHGKFTVFTKFTKCDCSSLHCKYILRNQFWHMVVSLFTSSKQVQ